MDENSRRLIAGASGAGEKTYIEDAFSTFLYTGNGSTQTITNGIDLSGKGGMVWTKWRTKLSGADATNYYHTIHDTLRGVSYALYPNDASAQGGNVLSSFNSDGYGLANDSNTNRTLHTYASWTFRKAAKFFDVCTWSGSGDDKTVSHNLGTTPGCIIAKAVDDIDNWYVYHRSLAGTSYWLNLNTTSAAFTNAVDVNWNPTSTTFQADSYLNLSTSGKNYVAYLFAHDAGGFGDSGNESVIKCGNFTSDSSGNATVTLGWEPQWLLFKRTDSTSSWALQDTMRGGSLSASSNGLSANTSEAEGAGTSNYAWNPTATGFQFRASLAGSGATYIYIAIRRGPMKTPTDATKVFSALTATGSGGTSRSIGFPADMIWGTVRNGDAWRVQDRLRGFPTSLNSGKILLTTGSGAESDIQPNIYNVDNTSRLDGGVTTTLSYVWHHFRRAPGFFDMVAYTGTGSARTVSHNLGVAPELIIVKSRSSGPAVPDWWIYTSKVDSPSTSYLRFDGFGLTTGTTVLWDSTNPTSSVFSVGTYNGVNGNTYNYIAYLFASCPGVSKVGSYTGTGTTLQINCGFTNGARFVLIKRTDSTGDWYVWDTARGIVSANDPYLLLNSTAAEVTNTDYIDPYAAGFEISSTAPAAINANGGTYIYLAIA